MTSLSDYVSALIRTIPDRVSTLSRNAINTVKDYATTPVSPRVLAILIVLAILLCAGAIYRVLEDSRLVSHGRQATAVLVGWQQLGFLKGRSYYPVLRYLGPGGTLIQTQAQFSRYPDLNPGQEVMVTYDPDDPQTVRLTDEITFWHDDYFLMFVCFATLVIVQIAGQLPPLRRRLLGKQHGNPGE